MKKFLNAFWKQSLIVLLVFGCAPGGKIKSPDAVMDPAVSGFEKAEEEKYLFDNHKNRYMVFGSEKMKEFFNKKKAGQTVAIQFTDRKRLYDHNILLAAIFNGRIVHKQYGNLGHRFRLAMFFDLGSAILYSGGAPTVRDIYEDNRLYPHLSYIVASDINDFSSPKTEFINIYRKTRNDLPFPVEEISMSITTPEQVKKMVEKYVLNEESPVILRTVNTGIDYFYKEDELKKHFQAVLFALSKRNVLYFFNRFILFKPRESNKFQIIGEIFERMFAAEIGKNWRTIFWTERKLQDGFIHNANYIYDPL